MGRMKRAALRGVHTLDAFCFVYVYMIVCMIVCMCILRVHACLYVLQCLLLLVRVVARAYVCIFVYTQTCARERNPPTRARRRHTTDIGRYFTH